MSQKITWLPPKTSRAYLHPSGSERLVSVYPDFKITDLDLNDNGRHYNQPGFGVHLLFGSEPADCDIDNTRWDKPSGGIPIYTLHNRDAENGCGLTMTAFSSPDRVPYTYCALTVSNPGNTRISGTVGILPRYNKIDHYLTGLHDTGYEPYNPCVGEWYLSWLHPFVRGEDPLTAASDAFGWVKILSADGDVRWISREEQKNRFRAHDYFRIDYTLAAGERACVRLVMRRDPPDGVEPVPGYDDAEKAALAYWRGIQDQVTCLPAAVGLENLFRHNIAVSMQMLQRYRKCKDPEAIYARQGDVGRFIWIWEAVHYLTMLDDVGLSAYTTDAYRMWIRSWQRTDPADPLYGLLDDPYVKWDNANGAALWGMGHHLLTRDDPALFEEFRAPMLACLAYIQSRRDPAKAGPGEVKGLFTSGKASDWGEVGQHWTYTDAVNVYGIGFMADAFAHFGAPEAGEVRAIYEEYRAVVQSVLDGFAKEHAGERSYNMPHILGTPFEESYNHCFSTDGAPYLIRLGFMDPQSEIFEQMENFYREIGMLDDEHGLASRMTNDDCGSPGLYGNVYYTGVAEICWIEAWKRRGELDKAERYLDGVLRYNITPEYIVSERYCSADPWFTPWQPNGSGAGRLNAFLMEYFGTKKVKREE